MKFSVDAVIPTLNCATDLEKCLTSIHNLNESSSVNLMIIDAGSKDETLKIAKDFGCEVHIQKGMFSNGINGARNYGLKFCKSNFYWQVDADNEFVGKDSYVNLLSPLIEEPELNISNPLPIKIDETNKFINYLATLDRINMEKMIIRGNDSKNFVIINDLDYGLNNGSIIKKEDLMKVGGYDFDIRTLTRLRLKKLSKSAIVKNSYYKHHSVSSLIDYAKKLSRRVKLYHWFLENDVKNFIFPINSEELQNLTPKTGSTSIGSSLNQSIEMLIKTRDLIWCWGLIFPLPYAIATIRNPIKSIKVYREFISDSNFG